MVTGQLARARRPATVRDRHRTHRTSGIGAGPRQSSCIQLRLYWNWTAHVQSSDARLPTPAPGSFATVGSRFGPATLQRVSASPNHRFSASSPQHGTEELGKAGERGEGGLVRLEVVDRCRGQLGVHAVRAADQEAPVVLLGGAVDLDKARHLAVRVGGGDTERAQQRPRQVRSHDRQHALLRWHEHQQRTHAEPLREHMPVLRRGAARGGAGRRE